jgi:hypothetical protein
LPAAAVAFSSTVPDAVSLRQQGREFWVACSRPAKAQEVRDALLAQHFGYAPEDVEALVLATGFKIADTTKPKVEATPTQIASWARDPLGRVSIHLSDYWVERIVNFRLERVRLAVGEAAASIADPVMRAKWAEAMQRVLTESGEPRGVAFMELLNAINGSGQPRGQFVAALESLQRTPVGGNPYVDLALASLAFEDARTLAGPGYDTAVQKKLADAMRKLEAIELRDGGGGSVTRADGEVINRQAARILAGLGDEDAANRREWIARFMGMSAAERAEYAEGDLVELAQPGVRSMSAPNATSRELDRLEDEWADRQRMEQQINNIGAQTLPNFPDDDLLLNRGTESVTIDGMVVRKKRGDGSRYQPRYRVSSVTVQSRNPNAVTSMKGGLAVIELFNGVGKFIAADRRNRELTEYLAKKERLQQRLRGQRYRQVPPKPAKIKAAIDQLVALDARTTDQRTKQDLQAGISWLRALLEESRAAWPGQ